MFIKKHLWAILYSAALIAFTTYITLDTFVISHVYIVVPEAKTVSTEQVKTDAEETNEAAESENTDSKYGDDEPKSLNSTNDKTVSSKPDESTAQSNKSTAQSNESSAKSNESSAKSNESSDQITASEKSNGSSYKDENISITLTEYRENDTAIYVANITLSSPKYLQTAFAQNSYGKNITETTSEIAAGVNAIFAVNGDYYGARESGYVIRNGVIYRGKAASNQEDLVIYSDGSFEIISEDDITAEELLNAGAVQVLSFGPALITDGEITVSEGEEVGKAKASNPRTAIGIIDDLNYVFVVSDGRTSESTGLSLSQLAEFMSTLNVKTAYNLDGGGSSTMYFNGSVVNNPTTNGKSTKERSVSDIVYIGY